MTIRDLGRQSLKEGLRSAARIIAEEEITDHGNSRRARVDHRSSVFEGDTTDGDDWPLAGYVCGSTDELETNGRVTRILAPAAEHGSDRHVANRFEHRTLDLRNGVCRQTDDRLLAEQPARGRRRKIVLTDMDARRSG